MLVCYQFIAWCFSIYEYLLKVISIRCSTDNFRYDHWNRVIREYNNLKFVNFYNIYIFFDQNTALIHLLKSAVAILFFICINFPSFSTFIYFYLNTCIGTIDILHTFFPLDCSMRSLRSWASSSSLCGSCCIIMPSPILYKKYEAELVLSMEKYDDS